MVKKALPINITTKEEDVMHQFELLRNRFTAYLDDRLNTKNHQLEPANKNRIYDIIKTERAELETIFRAFERMAEEIESK